MLTDLFRCDEIESFVESSLWNHRKPEAATGNLILGLQYNQGNEETSV